MNIASSRSSIATFRTPRPWFAAIPAILVALMFLPNAGAVTPSMGAAHVATSAGSSGSHAPLAGSSSSAKPPAPAAPATHPSAVAFNPPCYPVTTGICVSTQSSGESQIIPNGSSRVSSVMPDCSQSIPLIIKSHTPLNATPGVGGGGTSPTWGPHSPIALNVTGTLWNGDPYYNKYDDSIWHANTKQWWVLLGETSNKTYPWWYLVNISATNSANQPNFFPGELVNWWIYIVYSEPNSQYVGVEGPHLQYTCSGAWPYSPYPGAPHYGGPNSLLLDDNVTLTPRAPNWNDSVFATINTTQADVSPYNATIGAATIDLLEISHGIVLVNTSWSFNVTVDPTSRFGNTSTTTRIGPQYAQIAGATISYRLWISDTSKTPDWLVSPWTNYTVNGNGSFPTGSFSSDLTLITSPNTVQTLPYGYANLTPGQPLQIQVLSRNPTDAVLAVQVQYTVAYPLLHETIKQKVELNRVTSIYFRGSLPPLPLESIVNLTVFAWDFTDAVEQSNPLAYSVQTLEQYNDGAPAAGLSFFYVFVYDNGTGTWVPGAKVQIQGPNGVTNSVGNTTLGVSYANQSGRPFAPLLVQANATYNVTVTDPMFVPGGGNAAPYGPISVDVQALNQMTATQPLATGANYIVLQEAGQDGIGEILFFLNGTAPPATVSPSASVSGGPLSDLGAAAVVGLVGASLACIPIMLWWRQIKARRTAEEKRVTL